MYTLLKTIHMSTAVLTLMSFLLRGVWMLRASSMLGRRWVRIVPHVIDAILLASAIALMVQIRQYPGTQAWLTAKVVAVVIYIVFGSVALKRGRTKVMRTTAWLGALAVYAYILMVALTHHPMPFLKL
ncbi:MAG: SirB2 family protein [Acidiferrobacterales bacterium]|nr:SirB2 family protein [Acidiferrobacterales bacterium]